MQRKTGAWLVFLIRPDSASIVNFALITQM